MNIICWWSGGVTSAVACKKAIDQFGAGNCKILFINTGNEHFDTYRFMLDCQEWYEIKIESISNRSVACIEDVWYDALSLNTANGAICSSTLKRKVRLEYERKHIIDHQVFGFEREEFKRADNLLKNYPRSRPIFPLITLGLSKTDCIRIITEAKIQLPETYRLGFHNNNCFQTGCVQGGIGYWKKIQREFPEKFDKMAAIEHDLTNLKGSPVTCLKDQSKSVKETGLFQVFLKKHPDYQNKCLDDMSAREPEPLVECNGFCGTSGMFQ